MLELVACIIHYGYHQRQRENYFINGCLEVALLDLSFNRRRWR